MSQHYKQIQHGNGEPTRMLRERLARDDMGDAAYDKAVSHADDRSFKIFGALFIAALAIAVLVVTWLGY